MVSNTTLVHIYQRLKQIFATPNNQLFAGLSIITLGDLYQLPPIRQRLVFEEYKNSVHNLCHPWLVFKMIELTENMRQKEDQPFTHLLNRFRTASQTEADIQCIQLRSVTIIVTTKYHDGQDTCFLYCVNLESTLRALCRHNYIIYDTLQGRSSME